MNEASTRRKAKAYGRSAAMTLEASTADDGETVNIEVAPRTEAGVQWASKVVVQASASELVLLAGLFLGLIPHLQLKRPGKGIDLERQPGIVFVKATAGAGRLYALPVTAADSYYVGSVILEQLGRHTPGLPSELLMAQLRGACALYCQKIANREASAATN